MTLRNELFSHKEKIWVLCLGKEAITESLSPLIDLVDWFNNQLLSKSLVAGKIDTEFGKSTLLGTTGLLPVSRLLVFGLGETSSLNAAQARKFLQDLDQVILDLKDGSPWVILPQNIPPKFSDEIEKSRTSFESLAQATISLGTV